MGQHKDDGGPQTHDVTCTQDGTGTVVGDASCDGDPPQDEQACNVEPCEPDTDADSDTEVDTEADTEPDSDPDTEPAPDTDVDAGADAGGCGCAPSSPEGGFALGVLLSAAALRRRRDRLG